MDHNHNTTWKQGLDKAINESMDILTVFDAEGHKDVSARIISEIRNESSDFHRFLDVFYEEALFDAEFSLAAEEAGNKKDVYHRHIRSAKQWRANMRHFKNSVNAALLFCRMSRKFGVEFAWRINEMLDSSLAHYRFLEEFFNSAMCSSTEHSPEE